MRVAASLATEAMIDGGIGLRHMVVTAQLPSKRSA